MRYLVRYSCKKILHLFVSSVVVFLCFPMVSEVSSGFIGSCNVVVLHVFCRISYTVEGILSPSKLRILIHR